MAYLSGRRERGEEKKSQPQPPADIDLEKLLKVHGELEEVHRQMRESHIEMILNLAIAAEYKDPDTGNHILRISDYATALATALRLPREEIEILRYASPMHDIGKIGIPDKILQKPGKLTPQEWEVMKTHTLIGSRMFRNSKTPLLKAVADISLSHHERFDGSGYPRGLKGKDIPLFGRIVAVVDVFDAVVTKRCYKDKWPFQEGADYIRSLGGTHLDPELVKAFTAIEKDVRKIYDANVKIQELVDEFRDRPLDQLL